MSISASTTAPQLIPADLPIRLAARAVDVLILIALDVGLGSLIGFGWAFLVVGSLMVISYFAVLDTVAGGTVGKRVLGLRVIGPEGGNPSLRQSFLRESFTLIGSIPLAGPLLALAVWIWLSLSIRKDPLRQGRHDLFAGGTRVVRYTRAMTPSAGSPVARSNAST